MTVSPTINQTPKPGARSVLYQGDTLGFTLTVAGAGSGSAWIRTNIGKAAITRKEIIGAVDRDETPLGSDWFDIPMVRVDAQRFQMTLALCEIGHFEGKCFFLPHGAAEPLWPDGGNVEINVAPANTCCANIIYNAFVRQFGPNRDGHFTDPARAPWVRALDEAGYTVIPPSGTFRDLIGVLDDVIGRLGCRIIQLLPVHPTPTTYARMGRFGSPYAALSFTEVDPALAEFDPRATPLDQFIELVDAVHARDAEVFIDIAINHTGWAASLHETHPKWLARRKSGEIEVPGAWGVTWADLTRLDYRHKDLWQYMAGIFIKWCCRGVDGFRCDAGYMIPIPAWRYIIATVREQFPDAVFVLEGLGGKIATTRALLNTAGFTWAYSELFQNEDRGQIEHYLPEAMDISRHDGIAVHFSETHDNNRLASRSDAYARMRTALCALLSQQGAFGFANGVEWLATEKINVHESPSLNWGATPNQVEEIRRLNAILRHHPAFTPQTVVKMIQQGDGNNLVALRHRSVTGHRLLVVVNLDADNESTARWDTRAAGMNTDAVTDLLTGKPWSFDRQGEMASVHLLPGQVLCLTADPADLDVIRIDGTADFGIPATLTHQRLRAAALGVFQFYNGTQDLGDFDPNLAAVALRDDPIGFCRRLNPGGDEPRVIGWQWPADVHREVMVPPGHFLLVRSPAPFRARTKSESAHVARSVHRGLESADGQYFALFEPVPTKKDHFSRRLKISVFLSGTTHHDEGVLRYLAPWRNVKGRMLFNRPQISARPLLMLGTNGRGGMLRAHVRWGELTSRYDALLAGNLNPELPDNRWVMFTRCRAWLVFQGYSQEVNLNCTNAFGLDAKTRGYWDFRILTGQGEHVRLVAGMEMVPGENSMRMVFHRQPASGRERLLADDKGVKLILRPDIEDRSFHETTKAFTGPEQDYPGSVTPATDHFTFSPHPERQLRIRVKKGVFVWEPEWHYMVHRSQEAERGQDPASDLFSPGYFTAHLLGGQSVELTARIAGPQGLEHLPDSELHQTVTSPFSKKRFVQTLPHALDLALDHFVVHRQGLKSVIAGYPWFLDWGRDSLIVVRGLVASGRVDAARQVLAQFGRFESDGTIPNMIQGNDAGNRDTADAPLWFAVACGDLIRAQGHDRFLDEAYGSRTIRQILLDIGNAYVRGTSNGIRVDPDSALVFSPAHYTWMDTAHPAGTPREGYPIEIQALWTATLTLLARIDDGAAQHDWQGLARRVEQSIQAFFRVEPGGYLADCLHAKPGVPAHAADADDALRPNQLFAIVFGAVTDPGMCRRILAACQDLLVPGAIRSLADRPVQKPLEIWHHGRLLNDPLSPYQGAYQGDEDTCRKPAYHNGTAWTWPFPTFCEAWAQTYGPSGTPTALDWLASASRVFDTGCIGHVPEIVDGSRPHRQRGCDAQAWGASEILRVWLKLTGPNPGQPG